MFARNYVFLLFVRWITWCHSVLNQSECVSWIIFHLSNFQLNQQMQAEWMMLFYRMKHRAQLKMTSIDQVKKIKYEPRVFEHASTVWAVVDKSEIHR